MKIEENRKYRANNTNKPAEEGLNDSFINALHSNEGFETDSDGTEMTHQSLFRVLKQQSGNNPVIEQFISKLGNGVESKFKPIGNSIGSISPSILQDSVRSSNDNESPSRD